MGRRVCEEDLLLGYVEPKGKVGGLAFRGVHDFERESSGRQCLRVSYEPPKFPLKGSFKGDVEPYKGYMKL